VRVRISTKQNSGLRIYLLQPRCSRIAGVRTRFQNQDPKEVGEPALRWLSRGLREALVAFVQRAKDNTYGLFGAIYEFQLASVLDEVRKVSESGATVSVVYDSIPGVPPEERLGDQRRRDQWPLHRPHDGKIMHNKFFVLTKNGQPVAAWMGSTNITENGLFGHLNCGQIIEDAGVAGAYLEYWRELSGNPAVSAEKVWTAANNANPPSPWTDNLRPVFSHERDSRCSIVRRPCRRGSSKTAFHDVCLRMHKLFQSVYERPDESFGSPHGEGGQWCRVGTGQEDIARIRRLPNVVVAVGNNIIVNSFDRWLKERAKFRRRG